MTNPTAPPAPTHNLSDNRALRLLKHATEHKYAVPAVCVYNLEGILATVQAAKAKRSPAMILLFPWAQSYSGMLLARAAAFAAYTAGAPVTVHLDHAQSPQVINEAADMCIMLPEGQGPDKKVIKRRCFDSIMVDMSHHEHEENLSLTKELTQHCHDCGIAVEAECGRIEGGEDGVSDTADLEGMMTSPEQAIEFRDTGVDWLAPAFGNVHGNYGPRGIQLEYDRLEKIGQAVGTGMPLVLHGTDGFDEARYQKCVKAGIVKANINRVVNQRLTKEWKEGKGGLTSVVEEGTKGMQEEVEILMDWLGSSGKAFPLDEA